MSAPNMMSEKSRTAYLCSIPWYCVWLAVLVTLAGCGGPSGFPVETHIVPYTKDQVAAREAAKSAEYRLRTGDQISVLFKYLPELDQKYLLVLPDGNISMAGLGTVVKAAGLSVRELDNSLTGQFAKDYRDPELSIVVNIITESEIYVLGQVKNPGLYKLSPQGGGVIQAVAAAGGFMNGAHTSETVILRATEEGFMIRKFDLSHLEYVGIQDLSYMDLEPYDIVYVPRSSLGDFVYLTDSIFGSAVQISRFFWDIYAIGNLNKINQIIR